MCDIAFEKTKGRGWTVDRTSVYAEAVVRRFVKKSVMRNSQENICAGIYSSIK